MIKSFGNQGTQDIFDRKDTKAARRVIHPKFWERARVAMNILHAALNLGQVRAHRNLRLHKLQGKLKEQYALDFGYRERVVFRYEELTNSATDVFISDDHYGD